MPPRPMVRERRPAELALPAWVRRHSVAAFILHESTRQPRVAAPSMFASDRAVYATQPKPLRTQITGLLEAARPEPIEGDVLALIVPDSNLLSGGHVAAEVFGTLQGQAYDTVILVAPSHTGPFRRMNICSVDAYYTPLGDLAINDAVRNELCDEDDDIFLDDTGHFHVEGIDVQLPFLQTVLTKPFDIVPIVMGEETPDFCRELGRAVGEVMYNRRTLVVASADLLEADAEGLNLFRTYLESMDVERLMGLLNSERVRMEGRGAVLVALIAAMHRRANRARVLHLEPPAEGRVGFAGAAIWRG
ncbi:MAG: AmmeMemoRadiSam system protein B [Bacteroidetes bacterium]|nr:MAG: AmmeMemoRadiSam system protein B [Bacteroidota bacterium]